MPSSTRRATDRGGANATGCCRGSFIGGVKRTQEVIELCDREKIYPETTVHPVEKLNEIYEWLDGSNDAGTRYVLDIKVMKGEGGGARLQDEEWSCVGVGVGIGGWGASPRLHTMLMIDSGGFLWGVFFGSQRACDPPGLADRGSI